MVDRVDEPRRYLVTGRPRKLAARLIALRERKRVHRVDLSQVVSKYIGETEKNLVRVFDAAERGSSILFFDEADALFGKRTSVQDAHDKYASQEISYLLQRLEDENGTVIIGAANPIPDDLRRRLRLHARPAHR